MASAKLSPAFQKQWDEHVGREQRRAEAQVAEQIAAGTRKHLRVARGGGTVEQEEDSALLLPFDEYDYIIVSFSGGKDSLACFLHLLELGVPKEKIELWHQSVDGEPGGKRFFDWPITEDYCRAVADAFGVRLLFQWLNGGFEGEITKKDAATQKSTFEYLDGTFGEAGGAGKVTTRMEFPKPGAIAYGRWCSSYLKIDVAKKAFTNDPRFDGAKTLVISGERAEESKNRGRYASVKRYGWSPKGDGSGAEISPEEKRRQAIAERGAPPPRRSITEWRPLINWPEEHVWEIISRYKVRPHPAYFLGFSRVSCMPCIFGNDDQWATVNLLDPALIKKIATYEHRFYKSPSKPGTIHPTLDVSQRAKKGIAYLLEEMSDEERAFVFANAELAKDEHYPRELTLVKHWTLPRGAGRGLNGTPSGGPT